MEDTNKKLDALFGAVEKATREATKIVEHAGVKLEVTQMSMKMFTEFAFETKDSKDNAHESMIKMLAQRIVEITVGDVVIKPKDNEECEEILSGTILRLTGDDAGELLDKVTEAIGLGKMLEKVDSKT